jgi:hypothetical protein
MSERDPNGLSAKALGSKLDAGKSPVRRGLLEYFPRACMEVAQVSAAGAAKYSWGGWQTVAGGIDRYGDAAIRHICKAAIEGPVDADWKAQGIDVQILHAAEEAWNALARLELILREREKAQITSAKLASHYSGTPGKPWEHRVTGRTLDYETGETRCSACSTVLFTAPTVYNKIATRRCNHAAYGVHTNGIERSCAGCGESLPTPELAKWRCRLDCPGCGPECANYRKVVESQR